MTSQADDAEAVVVHAENAAMKENSCNTVGNLADAAMQTLEVEVATEKRTPQMEKERRLDQRLARTSERLQLSPDADDDVAYPEALGDVAYKSVKDAMESLRGEVMAGLRDIEDALDDVDVDDETVILQNEVMTGMRSLDDTLGPLSGLSSPSSRSTEPCWDDVREVAAPSDPSLDDSDRFGAGRAAVRESRRPSRKSC
jgi:hypothetical protein